MEPGNNVADSGFSLRLKNAIASCSVIALACMAFGLAPYNAANLSRLHGSTELSFTGYQFLAWAGGLYALLLAAYLLTDRDPRVSKSLLFFRVLQRWLRRPEGAVSRKITAAERVAILTTLLKSFFGPLMAHSLMVFCVSALANGQAVLEYGLPSGGFRPLFDQFGFWFAMQVILFVDVLIFTVGYLIESPRLGNEIRSVDPTLVGWAAALLCYPPFNYVTSTVLGAQRSDFPQFDDPTLHMLLNITLLLLMATYASASIALGLKASNLTHRGIVARGPYAVVRHPAYVCKNLAWWIGASPVVVAAFGQSLTAGLLSVASVVAWSLLYVLRAVTEEDHLRSVDGDYAAYAAKVRYRFIPGVI